MILSIAISFHRFVIICPLLLWLTSFIWATFNSPHLGFKPLACEKPNLLLLYKLSDTIDSDIVSSLCRHCSLLLWPALFIWKTFNSSHLGFKPLPSRLPSPLTQRLSANCCNLQMFLPSEDSLCRSVFASFVIFLLARGKNLTKDEHAFWLCHGIHSTLHISVS